MTQLISPATRAVITHVIATPGKAWNGRRRGVVMMFVQSLQPDLENQRVQFRARWNENNVAGYAATLWDAVRQIETAVDKSKRRTK